MVCEVIDNCMIELKTSKNYVIQIYRHELSYYQPGTILKITFADDKNDYKDKTILKIEKICN